MVKIITVVRDSRIPSPLCNTDKDINCLSNLEDQGFLQCHHENDNEQLSQK